MARSLSEELAAFRFKCSSDKDYVLGSRWHEALNPLSNPSSSCPSEKNYLASFDRVLRTFLLADPAFSTHRRIEDESCKLALSFWLRSSGSLEIGDARSIAPVCTVGSQFHPLRNRTIDKENLPYRDNVEYLRNPLFHRLAEFIRGLRTSRGG